MAAPLGNRFWEARSSHGRKPTFENADDLWKACVEYFEWVEDNPLWEIKSYQYQGAPVQDQIPKMRAMTMDGLCLFIDVTDQTLHNYKERGNDFLEVITRAEKIIKYQKFTGAAADMLNPNIIARDLGLKDQTERELKGSVKIFASPLDEDL